MDVPLSKLAVVVTGSTPSTKDGNNWGGDVPFITPGDMNHMGVTTISERAVTAQGVARGRALPEGAVLVTCIGNLGRTTLAGVPCITNQQINAIVPTGLMSSRYVAYACSAPGFQRQLREASTSTTVALVNKSNFEKLTIPVAPGPEQERIVAAIEEQFSRLDAGVAVLKRVLQNLKRMRAAVYESAIAGDLTAGDEACNTAASWNHRALGDVLVNLSAGKSFKCLERPAREGEWGVVKVSAMTWGAFREDENKTVLPGREIDERLEIRPGDLLVSRANTLGYVGAVVLVGRCRPKLLLSDKSLRLEPTSDVLPEWLVVALRSRTVRRHIESVATGTSDSMRNISQPKLRALRIPVPPVTEQESVTREVSRQLSVLDATERAVRVRLQAAYRLRSSVLSAAFSGSLVHQDASDESASVLLERIIAGRVLAKAARLPGTGQAVRATA